MKAEWLDEGLHTCLCCGQQLYGPGKAMTPAKCERALLVFTSLGLTREELLGKYRAKIDYQSPGFAEWLQGQ